MLFFFLHEQSFITSYEEATLWWRLALSAWLIHHCVILMSHIYFVPAQKSGNQLPRFHAAGAGPLQTDSIARWRLWWGRWRKRSRWEERRLCFLSVCPACVLLCSLLSVKDFTLSHARLFQTSQMSFDERRVSCEGGCWFWLNWNGRHKTVALSSASEFCLTYWVFKKSKGTV